MPNLDDTLMTRRTVYKFLDQTVSKENITKAITAAAQAPCHKHTHPWKFYVLGEKAKIESYAGNREVGIQQITKTGLKKF